MEKIKKGLIVYIIISLSLLFCLFSESAYCLRVPIDKGYNRLKEVDTYAALSRSDKAGLSREEIFRHWNETRAGRPGVTSVLTTRRTEEQNIEDTKILQEILFRFLDREGIIKDKRIFELGVGIGRMTFELAKRAKEIVGNDISLTMLQRTRERLAEFKNVNLHLGKIAELDESVLQAKSFDLVFESIVLLHILNPEELKGTIEIMQRLSDRILIIEDTSGRETGKYAICRTAEEYEELFKPYRLLKKETHKIGEDTLSIMLFENPTPDKFHFSTILAERNIEISGSL